MKIIGAGARDDIHHPARCPSVFRCVPVSDDLEFLNGLLRHGRADTVDRIIHRVGPIHVYQVGASALPAHIQPGCRSSSD